MRWKDMVIISWLIHGKLKGRMKIVYNPIKRSFLLVNIANRKPEPNQYRKQEI